MGHEVLARKWRPQVFDDVVGQEHAVRILTHALDSQRLHHAWLLTGTRGVGKTTLARILAKSLNCEAGISSHPCGHCQTCEECDAGKFIDLLEIDAASRTKVEDTRDLLQSIQYAPARGRFRIYLIDEVHMLSGHSFNALLKTLEEPPPHVKFLLATTDPDKLPVTVLSRCLQIHLHHVSPEKITQHLQKICAAEHITAEPDALSCIAIAAKGSLRDALSLLDQAIAFSGNALNATDVQSLTGTTGTAVLLKLLASLLARDGARLLADINALTQNGPDFDQVTADLLSLLHTISVQQILPSEALPETLRQFATQFAPEEIQLYYQIALTGRRDLAFAPTPASGFEMIMLRMLAFVPESHTPVKIKTQASAAPIHQKISIPTATVPIVTTSTVSHPTDWQSILPHLKLTGMTLALASHCQLASLSENRIDLILASKHESLLNKNLTERLRQAISDWYGKPMQLHITHATQHIETPASLQQARHEERQQQACGIILKDSGVQKIIDTFDATLDPDSIRASDSA